MVDLMSLDPSHRETELNRLLALVFQDQAEIDDAIRIALLPGVRQQ